MGGHGDGEERTGSCPQPCRALRDPCPPPAARSPPLPTTPVPLAGDLGGAGEELVATSPLPARAPHTEGDCMRLSPRLAPPSFPRCRFRCPAFGGTATAPGPSPPPRGRRRPRPWVLPLRDGAVRSFPRGSRITLS